MLKAHLICSTADRGAMILGNGELGALAWVSSDGTLHTVLQRSDTWNEAARHVKVGAIDYVTSMKVDAGTYRQELSLAHGEFNASWRSGGREVSVHYRVQHGDEPFAVCYVKGTPKAEAKVVNWRLYPGGAKEFGCSWKELGNQCDRILVDGKPLRYTVSADRLVPGGWCHVNRNATVAEMMKVYDRFQATGDLGREDMLSNRVFGGVTRKVVVVKTASVQQQDGDRKVPRQDGNNLAVVRLLSPGTSTRTLFLTAITCYHPCKDEAEWLRRTNELLDRYGWTLDAEAAKRAAHEAAWRAFWNRSHIAVTPAAGRSTRARFDFPYNAKLPVSIGRDSKGETKFTGALKVDPASRTRLAHRQGRARPRRDVQRKGRAQQPTHHRQHHAGRHRRVARGHPRRPASSARRPKGRLPSVDGAGRARRVRGGARVPRRQGEDVP